MIKYINANELYERVAEWEAQALHMVEVTMNDEDLTEWRKWSAILNERSAFKFDVADFPAADVVEVVRCKECKHKYGYKCDYDDRPVGRGDYCSRGERMDEVEE